MIFDTKLLNALNMFVEKNGRNRALAGLHFTTTPDKNPVVEATNGHIAVRLERKKPLDDGEEYPDGIYPLSSLPKKGSVEITGDIVDAPLQFLVEGTTTFVPAIFATYPDLKKVIPTDRTPAQSFAMFSPYYMEIVAKMAMLCNGLDVATVIHGKTRPVLTSRPFMVDSISPALWIGEYSQQTGHEFSIWDVYIVLMPVKMAG